MIQLPASKFIIRTWQTSDANSLALHANNPKVAENLGDTFPQPYQESDAKSYISFCLEKYPDTHLGIAVNGLAVGAIGFKDFDPSQKACELGYWLGEAHWNQGILTEAVALMCHYAEEQLKLQEVFAYVFKGNVGSARVLEKNGFQLLETVLDNTTKKGKTIEKWYYTKKLPA